MFEHILGWVAGLIVGFISATGYLGIVLLMAIESACIPLPSEVIMPFSGYLVSTGRFDLWAVATAGAIGCNLGSILPYEAGKRGGRPVVERWGKYFLVDLHDLDRAERFFARFGSIATLIGRLLPVVRSFIALPAGVARMPLVKFHVYTFVGSWPWCFGLAWVGRELGEHWNSDPRIKALFHRADLIIGIAIVLAVGYFLYRRLAKRRAARP
ncbi:DedA family protein [Sphingomonas profundi]|uniref:DedA family protein n=1 Tax=Alterirhizorhabdus profundi TaxID=2681549 RepID=UPI001E5BE867|nr:DedA family protein [Sphingomonas profundi]